MNILFLAPHPFYQERGTPIAVRLLLQALSRRGDHVDVVTYHEGQDLAWPGVQLHRIAPPWGIKNIPPGFSWKKLICDVWLLAKAWRLARRQRYHLMHAVEEGAFIALLIKRKLRIPYVYDMDSCLSQQMTDKNVLFRPLAPILRRLENIALRQALAVVPVCDALADIARRQQAEKIWILRDIALLSLTPHCALPASEDLRLAGVRFMYIGNLESYQGIDLLLRAFARLHQTRNNASLIIVGGAPRDVAYYQAQAVRLGVDQYVRFIGPRPLNMMAGLFRQADVLVSPRTQGINTPMKIYSYLLSGKPILATDLPTHTQVLNADVALLAPPTPQRFAEAMRYLMDNPEAARLLARRAAILAEEKYSLLAFDDTVAQLYVWLESQILP